MFNIYICFQCLADPLRAQYNGGIVVNPDMNEGLKGWSKSGFANMATRMSSSTNNTFIVATNRKGALHGFTQKYFLQKDTHYVTSGIFAYGVHKDFAQLFVLILTIIFKPCRRCSIYIIGDGCY